jgi:L-aspartate oxidase
VLEGCKSFGLDLRTDLLPLTPAAHYYVGGVQTDLDGRSSIPRLYAVGECSNTGAHGANRLAGNSLAEAMVFGRRAARAISGQRVGSTKSLPDMPELHGDDVPASEDWERLRRLCSTYLGLERDAAGLKKLSDDLEALAVRPSGSREQMALRSAATTARLIARSAALRIESRGVHHRSDHPDPVPAWAGIRLRVAHG